jgi:hypothetical protein
LASFVPDSGEDRERILKFASSGLPVFVLGEEGTGKGSGQALHFLGPWKTAPSSIFLPQAGFAKFVEKLSLWGKTGIPRESVMTLYLDDAENLDENMQTLLLDL